MGFVFFLIFGGIIFAVATAHKRHMENEWGRVASELGLQLHRRGLFSHPSLTGVIGKIGVRVSTVSKGKNNTYTVYAVKYPAQTRPFRLSREHMLHGLAKMFGAQDVTVGEHRFDSSFIVKAQDPGALAAYLTPSRRIELLAFAATNRSMVATESLVEATYRGADSRSDRIITRIRRIVSVAEHLTNDDVAHDNEDRAFRDRQAGELAQSARDLQSVRSSQPTDYGIRLAEIEAMVAADELDAAQQDAEELTTDLPADPELEGWIREIDAMQQEYATTPSSVEQSSFADELAGPVADADDLPSDEIIQDLFGSTKLSFETAERFRLNYKLREVDWQGVVKSARKYSSDYDFGQDAGVKAVVTVAEVEHDLYGNSSIDAVVQFPEGTELDRDDVVTFTGRLVKVDPLMRNIYVANGTLVDD